MTRMAARRQRGGGSRREALRAISRRYALVRTLRGRGKVLGSASLRAGSGAVRSRVRVIVIEVGA